ncbi:MAG: glucokinase [Thermoanaerobaculaceae bacterium]|nr:glucokinase [Thermoanaerobaculaceae bacterium]MDI9621644.1 glucokinase [Acidobacteriota bacterium]NLH10773.1 glucokinase [Holophagae bacterium]HPW55983.1 glucokinase [Thermoanaerobaculaceae bacterium]
MTVLAGDAGGTKTILALVEGEEHDFRFVAEERYPSNEYAGLAPIVRRFLDSHGAVVEAACFGVPGAVSNGECSTPNLPWFLSEDELQKVTGIPRVKLINDFAAAAGGVLVLPPGSLLTLQEGRPVGTGHKAVLGVGTGFGQAILAWDGREHLVLPTEAGHADFAPQGEIQRALAASLESQLDHVSVERLVSGPGLKRIYDFLVERGVSSWPEVREAFAVDDPPAVISSYALRRRDLACEQALDLFFLLYGAEAGNLALRTLPTGGVYVVGGIAIKNLEKLQDGTFIRAFRRKGRLRALLEQIPVYVVLDHRVGLLGAARQAVRLVPVR